MSQLSASAARPPTAVRNRVGAGEHRLGFDWVVAGLSVWMLAGLYMDGWAHDHFGADLGTFFTPWHGFLYAGFSLLAAYITINFVLHRRQGWAWRAALPIGYLPSLIGVGLFFAGAIGDLVWHTLFGIEVDIEALYSPTHLLLASAGLMILSGPLRAGMSRAGRGRPGWAEVGPAVISMTVLLAMFIFFSESFQPFAHAWAAGGNRPTQGTLPVLHLTPTLLGHRGIQTLDMVREIGLAGFLVQAVALVGVLLIAIRRWGPGLPVGSLALITVTGALLVGFEHDGEFLMPAAVLGAVAVEGLYRWLHPSTSRPLQLRLFAAGTPLVFYSLYFVLLGTSTGTFWSIHLWAGAIFLASGMGLLLSYVFLPSAPGEGPTADDADRL